MPDGRSGKPAGFASQGSHACAIWPFRVLLGLLEDGSGVRWPAVAASGCRESHRPGGPDWARNTGFGRSTPRFSPWDLRGLPLVDSRTGGAEIHGPALCLAGRASCGQYVYVHSTEAGGCRPRPGVRGRHQEIRRLTPGPGRCSGAHFAPLGPSVGGG